jgi:transposase-like protein
MAEVRKRELEVAFALAMGKSVPEAAKENDVAASTIRLWLRDDPQFLKLVNEARDRIFDEATGRLASSFTKVADELVRLSTESKSDTVRVQAARAVMEYAFKGREVVELTRKVNDLEAMVKEKLKEMDDGRLEAEHQPSCKTDAEPPAAA